MLSVPLRAGDKTSGQVKVISDSIAFAIKDVHGQLILGASDISDRKFDFVPDETGIYQFIFGNATNLVINRVALLQITHSGGAFFSNPGGHEIPVKPDETASTTVDLSANLGVRGTLSIQGGDSDVMFSITGPGPETILPALGVRGSYSFSIMPSVSGTYMLWFDNTGSLSSKLVSVEMDPITGREYHWWGASLHLAFTTQPKPGSIFGSMFDMQPVVTVQDATGATVNSSAAKVTLEITPGTGASGAVLSGTKTVGAVNGVAVFSGLGINVPGPGYTLTATAEGIAPADSAAFNVTLPPNGLGLNAGWNLVSLPPVTSNTSMADIFSGVIDKVISIWHYDGASAEWSNFVPGIGGSLLTFIDGEAYWVNMSAPAILLVDGDSIQTGTASAYRVTTGWNMIGASLSAPKNMASYLKGTAYRSFPVYCFTSGTFSIIRPDADCLKPGLGYWVYFDRPGVIEP
ncbi:MAG: emp24/gp25L/p24 family protein [Dehalococcoidales bacterium]|nr:emp24/gp25L/p24 family protein [Dehalococcoidales bacterium]